ncbi:MAG: hypothetical protein HDR01_11280 [Lachnospiraceae bacterium]|nr:hypothetical protein [Lachnospiraceae bacterium]
MKKKAFKILLCGNLLILFPSIWIELIRYDIIPFECLKYALLIMSFKWLNILILFTYGVLFSMPAMIIISISTLIIIEKELKKENLILFIWLIFEPLWLLMDFTDMDIPYEVFALMPIIAMIIICISALIIIKKEHKKGNIIKHNLFIWLILWVLNVIAILCSFDLGMFIARQ